MPFLIYSGLRLALIVVAGLALYVAGTRGWLLGVVAVVVALLVSYLALNKQRTAAATYLAERRARRTATGERFSKAVEDDAAAEDDVIESAVPEAGSAHADRSTAGLSASEQTPGISERKPDGE